MSIFKQGAAPQEEAQDDEADEFAGMQEAAKKVTNSSGARYPHLYTTGLADGFVVMRRATRRPKRLGGAILYTFEMMIVERRPASADYGPGTNVVVMEGMDKEGADKRLAAMFMRFTGCGAEDITKANVLMLMGEAQPMNGLIAGYSCVKAQEEVVDKETKKKVWIDKINTSGECFVNAKFHQVTPADFRRLTPVVKQIDPSWEPNPVQPGAVAQ